MLRDRGYLVAEEDFSMTLDNFQSTFGDYPDRNALVISSALVHDESEQLMVFFPTYVKANTQVIQKHAQLMRENGSSHAILVLQEGLTSAAAKITQEGLDSFRFETFTEKELLVSYYGARQLLL